MKALRSQIGFWVVFLAAVLLHWPQWALRVCWDAAKRREGK